MGTNPHVMNIIIDPTSSFTRHVFRALGQDVHFIDFNERSVWRGWGEVDISLKTGFFEIDGVNRIALWRVL